MAKFKQTIIDKIKDDADLFAVVSKAMKVKPITLASTIDRNGATLNQYHVVKAVADFLKKSPDTLIEKETEAA